MRKRYLRIGAAALAVGFVVAGFAAPWNLTGSTDEERCEAAVTALADEVQGSVNRLAGMTAVDFLQEGLSGSALVPAIQRRLDELEALGCDPDAIQESLVTDMGRVQGEGAIATAVVDALRDSLLDLPVDEPREIAVGLDDDLAALAVTAPSRSTLFLEAGDHRTHEPLVVAKHLTITGTGRDDTRILSTAEEVAVLVLEQGDLELTDVTVSHDVEVSTAVMQISSDSYTLRRVRITGGRAGDDGSGGTGLLVDIPSVGPAVSEAAEDGRNQVIDDVEVVGNDGPGVLIAGAGAPTISAAEVRGSGGCGVCYTGTEGGVLRDSMVAGNEVGVAVGGRADPEVVRTRLERNSEGGILIDRRGRGTFRDNEVLDNGDHGVVVTDAAAPELTSNRIERHDEAAVVLTGSSRAVLADNELIDHKVGVWVEEGAAPVLDGNQVSGTGVTGMAFVDDAGGRASGNRVDGQTLGIEVRDRARPEFTDNVVSGSDEAAIVLRGEARVGGARNRCEGSPFDVVVLEQAASDLEGEGCRIHDQR